MKYIDQKPKASHRLILKREVTLEECPWLPRALECDSEVFEYTGHTYGCCSYTGIMVALTEPSSNHNPDCDAVSFVEGIEPFFELPCNALKYEDGRDVPCLYFTPEKRGEILRGYTGVDEGDSARSALPRGIKSHSLDDHITMVNNTSVRESEDLELKDPDSIPEDQFLQEEYNYPDGKGD